MNIIPKKISDKKSSLIYYNIEIDEIPVGFLALDFGETGEYIYLNEIYILEEFRRKGFASKAIEWLVSFGAKFGTKKIWLFVPFMSEDAQRIYKKYGFIFLNHINDYCYKMEYDYGTN